MIVLKNGWDTEYLFTSGRKFYAHGHIVGIAPDLGINEGYDSGIDDEDFTEEDKKELALFMIELWKEYARLPS